MNKKFHGLAAAITLSACIGLGTPAFAVSLSNASSSIQSSVSQADSAGLLPDSLDGMNSSASLTRAQLCSISVRLYAAVSGTDYTTLLDEVQAKSNACPFTDTDNADVRAAWVLGLAQDDQKEFHPDDDASRGTLFSMLYAALKQADCGVSVSDNQVSETLGMYSDAKSIADGAAVTYFLRQGVTAINAERFDAEQSATCAQVVVLASRALTFAHTERGTSSAPKVSALSLHSGSASVSWSNCGADNYRIYFYQKKNGPALDTEMLPADGSGTQQLDFPETIAAKTGTWYWSVDAFDCSGHLIGTSAKAKLTVTENSDERATASISENTVTRVIGGSSGGSTMPSLSAPSIAPSIVSSVRKQGLAYSGESYSSRVNRIFGNTGTYHMYSGSSEARQYQKVITINIWDFNSSGEKVTKTTTLTINEGIADTVQQIFDEIYESDEQYPIHSIGGYCWRGDGSSSEHCLGLAIDINPDENYMCTNTGAALTGSHWTPGSDPYSIAADSDVVKIFAKYGFTWGGTWRTKKDYMHFSYFGT